MRRSILLILWTAAACKTASSSQLKHEWGRTVKSGHELSCLEEASGPYQAYIRQHIERIAAHNPTVFSGALASKNFCVMPIEAEGIDAGASGDGTLFINTGVLKAADSDAQFAAAIAHELAHITMRHGTLDVAAFVLDHPEYHIQFEKLNAVLSDARKAAEPRTPYQEKLRSLIQKEWNRTRFSAKTALDCSDIARLLVKPEDRQLRDEQPADEDAFCRSIDSELQKEHQLQSLYSNWKETEADEVGYEFHLKSAYAPLEYASFFENVARITGGEPNCDRGEKDHPGDCWRARNIREELQKHGRELGYAAGSAKDVFGPSLVDLKKVYGAP